MPRMREPTPAKPAQPTPGQQVQEFTRGIVLVCGGDFERMLCEDEWVTDLNSIGCRMSEFDRKLLVKTMTAIADMYR